MFCLFPHTLTMNSKRESKGPTVRYINPPNGDKVVALVYQLMGTNQVKYAACFFSKRETVRDKKTGEPVIIERAWTKKARKPIYSTAMIRFTYFPVIIDLNADMINKVRHVLLGDHSELSQEQYNEMYSKFHKKLSMYIRQQIPQHGVAYRTPERRKLWKQDNKPLPTHSVTTKAAPEKRSSMAPKKSKDTAVVTTVALTATAVQA